MSDTNVLLSGIEYKLRKLIADYERISKTVDIQEAEILRLRQENEIAFEKLSSLTEKFEIKMVADQFSSKTEIEEGRKRIQTLMRDIEQSIALLNQ